jgi:MFS family permease
MPLGALAFGWLATAFDRRSVLLVSAVLYAVLSLATLAAPSVRGLRQVTDSTPPVGPGQAPH